MSSLLKLVLRSLYERKITMATLIPSEKSLFNYYGRFGFSTAFYISRHIYDKTTISALNEAEAFKIERIEPESEKLPSLYEKYREYFTTHKLTIYKSFERFRQSVREHSYDRTETGFFSVGEGSAFVYFGDKNLFIRETTGIKKEALAESFIKKFNKPVIIEDIPEENNKIGLGMARILNLPMFLKKADKMLLNFSFNIKDDIIAENNIKTAYNSGDGV
jgi:predicted acetyltransferase